MENTIQVVPMDQFLKEVDSKQAELDSLRLNGVTKIENLRNEITNIKKNKQLDKETKGKLIAKCKEELLAAKQDAADNKGLIKEKVVDLISYIKGNTDSYIAEKKADNKQKKLALKEKYKADLISENERYKNALTQLRSEGGEDLALKVKDLKVAHKQTSDDLKVAYADEVDKLDDELHQLYLTKFNSIETANNKKLPVLDNLTSKVENYKYSFNTKTFILNNGLYLAIIALLIFAIIFYAVQNGGGFLLNTSTILLILNQTAPKIFLAFGFIFLTACANLFT